MESEVIHEKYKFYIIVDEMEAHMEYEMNGGSTVIFYHTYVPPKLRGRGLAKKIIQAGLDWAMGEAYVIIPTCSAVQRFIEMNEQYKSYFMK
jgi:predicted GNAT family acetyltransferase